ncbi:hypothetical protein TrispH2_003026 [Trichoplax sp. H2]|nr:hypothetical protein TrispH2_003026 [Trichoplax sp. H2]|eukprot:RDD44362.1 hypothetical protein TrispH2_003026 [Trichoplax sp. H2]
MEFKWNIFLVLFIATLSSWPVHGFTCPSKLTCDRLHRLECFYPNIECGRCKINYQELNGACILVFEGLLA